MAVESHAQSRLGRLFSDPGQRIELDRLRSDLASAAPEGPAVAPATGVAGVDSRSGPEVAPPSLPVMLDGIVVRSDGHRVAWVDGVETVPGATTPAGVRIETVRAPGARLRVRLPDGRTSAVLRPGQSVDPQGRTRDAYERRPPGTAADAAGGRPDDPPGSDEGEDAGVPVGSPDAASRGAIPADLLRELLREARADSAPLAERASGAPSSGD